MRDLDSDPFAASRMPFGSHLEELQVRFWRALLGFCGCLFLVFVVDMVGYATGSRVGVARPVFELLTMPVERELTKYHLRRAKDLRDRLLAEEEITRAANAEREVPVRIGLWTLVKVVSETLGASPPLGGVAEDDPRVLTIPARIPPLTWVLALDEAHRLLHRPPSLKVMGAAEGMAVYLKVAILCGIVLGSPWVFGQLWAFVAAGLHSHEKRLVHFYLPISLLLFFAGIALCQVWVMPATLEALLGFNAWLDVEPDLRLNEWLNFALLMPLVFGLAFQTPLVMWVMERLGVIEEDAYRRHRKTAWFLLALAAAVLTPGVDLYSMLFLWLPLVLLYEVGIWLCWFSRRDVCMARDSSIL